MVVLLYWVKVVGLSLVVIVGGLKMMVMLWWRPRRIEEHFAKQGIRGPSYRFFIGNLKEVVELMLKASSHPMPFSHNILPRVLSFYHHWNKIYGRTFVIWFGAKVRLTVSDPELIREIFTSKSEMYEKVEADPVVKQLEGDGLLSLKGKKWAHHRKIIAPTFHMDNLKLLVGVIADSVIEMLDKSWASMSLPDADELEIEVSEWFQSLTEHVITRAAFGATYQHAISIFRLQSQQMLFAAQAFRKLSISGYRYFPTKTNIKSWRLDREIKRSLTKLIEKRSQNSSNIHFNNNEEGPKDLLGLMIKASSNPNPNVTVHDIVEECKSFFFAGKQTTSNLLTWTTVLLAMHPEWQLLARDEVLEVCGSRDVPSKDHLSKLKTLNMILNESLRLYPPIIATIRRSKRDVDLGGHIHIPAGTELLIPILAVHHDHAIWGNDANEFNPARFSQGVARAAKHPLGFIPFGLGLRTCIGQNLAILQAKITLAIILQRFSFTLSPAYRHAPTVLMLLYPQFGAPIIFKPLPFS